MGLCADRIYSLPESDLNSAMIWLASIAYTLQIYYDFSGYSDMAIGLGKMFGFKFKENFRLPYTAHSIREFWRKWHISLSSWFRDYVYIPLGGNRHGDFRTYCNLIIVFFLTGIWHGASWTFVFWGLYHGFFCIIERIGIEKKLAKMPFVSWVYMILVVNFGWVFFRVDNFGISISFILKMLQPWRYLSSSYSIFELVSPKMIVFIFVGALGAGGIQRLLDNTKLKKKWTYSVAEMIYCLTVFFLSIMCLAGSTYNPFIYFRF
jgi:alginate O-acetyltransferase complex protein AlgI